MFEQFIDRDGRRRYFLIDIRAYINDPFSFIMTYRSRSRTHIEISHHLKRNQSTLIICDRYLAQVIYICPVFFLENNTKIYILVTVSHARGNIAVISDPNILCNIRHGQTNSGEFIIIQFQCYLFFTQFIIPFYILHALDRGENVLDRISQFFS